MTARLELSQLVKEFPGGVQALAGVDLTIEPAEFFALLGPSGCGKTTMLRSIAGLEIPTSGTITIDERDVSKVPPGKRDIAMVFQDYALYPHMTVVDNVAYPLKVRKVPGKERRELAAEAAGNLQLSELLDRRPGQLSGGQQQRVALARAIAHRPKLFLFDEPLSNLDARLRLEARTFLKRLQKELGVTTIYVTHDQSEALALADRIAVMEQGHLRQLDTPLEVYRRPSSLFVASFIGSTPMNLMPATVRDGHLALSGTQLPVPEAAVPHIEEGQGVVLGFRPEHASVDARTDGPYIEGEVAVVELLGIDYLVTVESGGRTVQAITRTPPAIGDTARVTFDDEHGLVYRTSDGGLVGTPILSTASVMEEQFVGTPAGPSVGSAGQG